MAAFFHDFLVGVPPDAAVELVADVVPDFEAKLADAVLVADFAVVASGAALVAADDAVAVVFVAAVGFVVEAFDVAHVADFFK